MLFIYYSLIEDHAYLVSSQTAHATYLVKIPNSHRSRKLKRLRPSLDGLAGFTGQPLRRQETVMTRAAAGHVGTLSRTRDTSIAFIVESAPTSTVSRTAIMTSDECTLRIAFESITIR